MAGRAVDRGKVLDRLQLPHVTDPEMQNAFKMVVDAIYGLQDRRQNGPLTGKGSPEGVVTATVGTLYTRTDGGAGTTLYVKESGTGNTGWVAK